MNLTAKAHPDLPDMIEAGMGLTEALAFWSGMMNMPQKPVEYWWLRLQEFKRTFGPILN